MRSRFFVPVPGLITREQLDSGYGRFSTDAVRGRRGQASDQISLLDWLAKTVAEAVRAVNPSR